MTFKVGDMTEERNRWRNLAHALVMARLAQMRRAEDDD